MRNLHQPLPSLLLTHKPPGNKLHKNRKILSKPLPLLPKQRTLRNTSRINTTKTHTTQLMILRMQHIRHHHQTQFRVFVRLGTIESVSVRHGDGIVESGVEAVEIFEVGDGVDAAAADGVVVSGYGAYHYYAGVGCVAHVFKEFTNHKQMRKIINLHSLLMPIHTPLSIRQRRLIHTRITNQPINRLGTLELLHIPTKLLHRFKGIQFTVHGCEVIGIKVIDFGNDFHFIKVSYGTDYVVFAGAEECEGCFAAEAGGCSGDYC
mmetsp:Transcript_28388/g.33631  ORF Transcript_28388/g.33631 Transcript_28388/m.33631 type:complete len:263 (-) Transcript_28388:280-1068(-)